MGFLTIFYKYIIQQYFTVTAPVDLSLMGWGGDLVSLIGWGGDLFLMGCGGDLVSLIGNNYQVDTKE